MRNLGFLNRVRNYQCWGPLRRCRLRGRGEALRNYTFLKIRTSMENMKKVGTINCEFVIIKKKGTNFFF